MAGSAGIHDSLIIDFDVFRKCWNLFVVMTGFWLGRCGQGHGMVCCVPLSKLIFQLIYGILVIEGNYVSTMYRTHTVCHETPSLCSRARIWSFIGSELYTFSLLVPPLYL